MSISGLSQEPGQRVDHTAQTVGFDAIQQFVVAPDRRYRVELHDGGLQFIRTGSQFDADWVARGAVGVLGPKVGEVLKKLTPRGYAMWGAVITGVSVLIFLVVLIAMINSPMVTTHKLQAFAVPIFGVVFGLVMIIAASFTYSSTATSHNFSLPLSGISEATLQPAQSELARRGELQVARVRLRLVSGKSIQLAIPTKSDLATLFSLTSLH